MGALVLIVLAIATVWIFVLAVITRWFFRRGFVPGATMLAGTILFHVQVFQSHFWTLSAALWIASAVLIMAVGKSRSKHAIASLVVLTAFSIATTVVLNRERQRRTAERNFALEKRRRVEDAQTRVEQEKQKIELQLQLAEQTRLAEQALLRGKAAFVEWSAMGLPIEVPDATLPITLTGAEFESNGGPNDPHHSYHLRYKPNDGSGEVFAVGLSFYKRPQRVDGKERCMQLGLVVPCDQVTIREYQRDSTVVSYFGRHNLEESVISSLHTATDAELAEVSRLVSTGPAQG
jgi:hypothetical protein